jgi:steroid 5-alpha reductase family enzyme
MLTLTTGLFALGVVLAGGQLLGYVASLLGRSAYWPLGTQDRWYYLHWGVSVGANLCLAAVALLDWNALGAPQPLTLAVGAVVFVPSYVAGIVAGSDLGQEETMGLTGDLRTDGWYRYSRNPQYVCYSVASVGVVVLAASPLATVLALLHLAWWLLMPFAEEPWLRDQYGTEYDRYCDRVPRFLGWRTARALVGAAEAETGTGV